MSLNCNEINVILDELDLTGSFIQEVVQPNYDSIALYTYKPGIPKTVFISLAAGSCRLNETRRKITKNEKPLRFNELLKSKLKGARIISCQQIQKERIIKIEMEKAGTIYVMPKAQEKFQKIQDKKASAETISEEDSTEYYTLYIRLWSNAGNIFLCGKDDVILDSFYRRPAKNEMKGEKFLLPEPKTTQNLKEFPVRTFDEITESRKEKFPDEILSFNQKVDIYYSETAAQTSVESLLEQAEKWYQSHRSKLKAATERLEEKRKEFLAADRLKHQGDLILAFGYGMEPNSNFLECEDYETGNKIRIKIDASKSVQENASIYYDQYKKATSGLESLEHDIQVSRKEIEELDAQYKKLISEKNPIKLEQILRKTQKPKQQEKKTHPGLEYNINDWTILVGRDATENDDLLRHNVKGNDLWLHVRDYHGGYVFIKNRPGKTVPLEILLYAGNLAVYHSKARKNGSSDLYYTHVKYLRRTKDGPKGLVIPTNEKNLFIKLDEEKLRKLQDSQS